MPDLDKHVTTIVAATLAAAALGYMVVKHRSSAAEAQKKKSGTLYERIGGPAAVDAAVDIFYQKVLADPKINHFFAHTNMTKQRQKQKNFMSYAFGAPGKYTGLAMDAAHRKLVREQGMNDSHFDAVAGHLKSTLEELKVDPALINEVLTAVEGLREQVMCRGQWANP